MNPFIIFIKTQKKVKDYKLLILMKQMKFTKKLKNVPIKFSYTEPKACTFNISDNTIY